MQNTKQKCIPSLKVGDIVVTKPTISSVPSEWPVIRAEPHKDLRDCYSVAFSYEASEPDRKGGMKIVAKATGAVTYHRRENVLVLVK